MKKLSIILLVVAFVSCKNEADPEADKSFFTKFYDNTIFNIGYTPLDVAQTSDGGYLVLALKRAVQSAGEDVDPGTIYIMKTDEFGAMVSYSELDETLRMPAPNLINVGGKFYFFCTLVDANNFILQLIEVAEDGTVAQQVDVRGANGGYALAGGVDGTSLMLLNFDPASRNTIMSVVGTDGEVSDTKEAFTIGAADGPYAPESSIINHSLRTGPQLPFFVGKTIGGQYYFNGMYNYTLSTVFTALDGSGPVAVLDGNNDNGGMSALLPLSGGKYAAARFNFGDNYLLPSATLPTGGVTAASELKGNAFPELAPNALVKVISVKVNGVDRVIYGTNTRGKQIALFGYNPVDGSFVGSRYIGFSNSFEIASIIPTTDEGLLVLGTTYIAGRFSRICLFKLSAEALGQSFQ